MFVLAYDFGSVRLYVILGVFLGYIGAYNSFGQSVNIKLNKLINITQSKEKKIYNCIIISAKKIKMQIKKKKLKNFSRNPNKTIAK